MWTWTRSEWLTRPFFLKFGLAPCCSRKPNPSRNPGTVCREEEKNLLTWHWWTNYQTTGKLRRIIIILVHRCWQHNSVISLREFQRKYDYGSSIVLSAINGVWFCVKQPLLCRQRPYIKSRTSVMNSPKVCAANYHPYLLQRCTCWKEGTDERQRQEGTEEGTLWCAHILPRCISESCHISITVEFFLSYERFLRFFQIRHCWRLL